MPRPAPPVAATPVTKDDVVRGLRRLHAASAAYWEAYDTPAFFAPMGEAWSPAEHVRHLTKSMRPVARALRIPKLVLWLRFGRPKRPALGYDALVAWYRERLSAGGKAGSFAPSPRPPAADPEAERARILAEHAEAVDTLADAATRWSERALDRHVLPHPLLGPLACREMLYFMLYHNQHHVHVAERRRTEAAAERDASGPPRTSL